MYAFSNYKSLMIPLYGNNKLIIYHITKRDKMKKIIYLIFITLYCAIIFYIPTIYKFVHYDYLYTSIGDGLKQMIPFQIYLIQHAKLFTMFYDIDFGLGGDYFSDLSYYYATSPFAWIGIVFVLAYQFFSQSQDLLNIVLTNQIVIAIFKCACIIQKRMKQNKKKTK